ncbi:MAG: hypothetical protein K2X78_09405 [Burkholderiaceae bacterium]|nr:hypothetical protein [Burkholderiaceae bacterium]
MEPLSRPPPEGSPVLLGQPAEALTRLPGGLFPRPPPDLPPVLLGAFSKKLCMFKLLQWLWSGLQGASAAPAISNGLSFDGANCFGDGVKMQIYCIHNALMHQMMQY